MEPERIALSQRDRDRLRLLYEVEMGHVTQAEAERRRAAGRQRGACTNGQLTH